VSSANKKAGKKAMREARETMLSRSCGTCDACCTTQGVAELGKPDGVRCEHQVEGVKGCSIYARRPKGCASWNCVWRAGGFDGVDRPDRVGVVMDVTGESEIYPDGQALVAREAFPGGFEKAGAFLAVQARKTVVILVLPNGMRRLIGPPDKVERIQAAMNRFLPVVS